MPMTGPRSLTFLKWSSRVAFVVGVIGVAVLVVLAAKGTPWSSLIGIGGGTLGCLAGSFSIRGNLKVLRQSADSAEPSDRR